MLKIGILAHNTGAFVGVGVQYITYFSQLGEVIPINPYNKDVVEIDVLVLPGGPDWDPDFYAQVPNLYTQKSRIEWTHFMKNVFRKYRSLNIPIIGICAGMQYMNIWAGGTLIQHLPHVVPYHKVNEESKPDITVHPVYIKDIYIPGTNDILFKSRTIQTTSRHHQAVGVLEVKEESIWYKTVNVSNKPGLGASIDAVGFSIEQDNKGKDIGDLTVVEVIVNFSNNMIGVQYHPESNMCQDTLELFNNFITYVQTKTEIEAPKPPVSQAITI